MKYYIVPVIGDGETTQTAFRPKYIQDLGISCCAMHIKQKNVYLIGVDTEDKKIIEQLESNLDVINISSNRFVADLAMRTKINSSMNLDINSGEDIVSKLGKVGDREFIKESFVVKSQ